MTAPTRGHARRLWALVRPHRRMLSVSLAAMVAATILYLVEPLLMGAVVDAAQRRDAGSLTRAAVALAATILAAHGLGFVRGYIMQVVGARSMAALRMRIFERFARLPMRVYDRTPVGRLLANITSDVEAMGELFTTGVLNALGDVLTMCGIAVLMLVLDWKLALVILAVLPALGLVLRLVWRLVKRVFRQLRARIAALTTHLHELIAGFEVVQAFRRERSMRRAFDATDREQLRLVRVVIGCEALVTASIEMGATLCIALILWGVGAERVGDGASFAAVVALTHYVRRLFEPLGLMAQRYALLQSAMAGAERVFALLDGEDDETMATRAPARAAREDEAIAFAGVDFAYEPGVPVLRDISFVIRPGETVALVGATGSGKSTMASLILRLYDCSAGSIRVQGRDVRSYTRTELRAAVAAIAQEPFLVAGTLLSNIALCPQGGDRARARAALARLGRAGQALLARGGLDARIDEGGANLSVGEQQLVALARVFYRDASILVLDEATASLDPETEAVIHEALGPALARHTAIIIAHRLSTIRICDRILVLHKGRLVEQGRHQDLLARGGVYARLYHLYFAPQEHAPGPDSPH